MSNVIRKAIRNNFKRFNFGNFFKIASTVTLAYTISLSPAFSQQIITDGNTNTQLNIVNKTTNITTSTIKGSNAFNSFVKFNVNNGNVVNLHVPDNASGLINLIHDESTSINGILNSVKAGKIGGNIFLVNPYGVTVGAQGVVNVGSLTVVTPTHDFMNNFFDAPGNPNVISVDKLINEQTSINDSAHFINKGKINAITSVKIDAGNVINQGEVYSGAVFKENDIELGDIVNLNTLESGSSIAVNNGEIVIKSKNDFVNDGKIIADGGDNVSAGSINITAENNINLMDGSLISAKGKGDNSNGGSIYIYANNNSYFNNSAVIDARGGNVSGDGGFIELSATNEVVVGGQFKASPVNGALGTILIDPATLTINTDQILPGTNINWTADETITVDGAVVSTRVIGGSTDYANAASTGDSGNVTMTAAEIYIQNNSEIYTHADNGFLGGDVTLDAKTLDPTLPLDALAIAKIDDSTIKAENISLIATGGNDIGNTYANAIAYAEDSTLISDGDITFTVTGGASLYEAYAKAYTYGSTITSDGDIEFTATGGDCFSYAFAHAYAETSTLTSDGDVIFAATGGTAASAGVYIALEDSTLISDGSVSFSGIAGTASSADPMVSIRNSILTSKGDIVLTSTGGTVNGSDVFVEVNSWYSTITSLNGNIEFTAAGGTLDGADELITKAYTSGTTLISYGDIKITATGGIVNSNTTASANTAVESWNSTVKANRDIVFTATGGTANAANGFEAYSKAEVIAGSRLNSGRDIVLTATGGTANSNLANYSGGYIKVLEYAYLYSGKDIKLEAIATQVGQEANVDIDSLAVLTAGINDRTLIVKADGSIDDIGSNIYAEILGGTINVPDIEEFNITLIATQVGGPGTITGEGTLNVYDGYKAIDITNNSNLDLKLNNMSTAVSGEIIKTGTYTGSYTENTITESASKNITVTNNGDSNVEFVGDIINSNGNVYITNAGGSITGDGCLISTRNIDGSTDYANAASTGDSGSVTMTAPVIYIQNNSEIYTHADSGFNGGDLTLNADASALIGVVDASAEAKIYNSIIKAADISLEAIGGNASAVVNAYANSSVRIYDSILTSDGDISLVATAGLANSSGLNGFTIANVYVGGSTVITSGNMTMSSTGGTATADSLAQAKVGGTINDSTLTVAGDITLTLTGGEAIAAILNDSYSVANIDSSTLLSGKDIIITSTGGTSSIATNLSYARVDVDDSDLESGENIKLEGIAIQNGNDVVIEITADSTLTAGSNDRTLIINADGIIDVANSNIYAEISGGTINVPDIGEGNITLIVTEVGGPGEIRGAGELTVYSGYQSIDITNNSNLGLQLNDINTAISGEIIKTGDYTGTYTENVIVDNTSKDITVTNNGDSNVEFVGDIINSNGNVRLTNESGLITGNGCLISTRNIGSSTDYADAVSIGDSGNVTMTAAEIYIQNYSEIYTHADNGFVGGDVTLDANTLDPALPLGAEAIAEIDDSTIKAENISLIATGGNDIGNTYANANANAEGSTLISDGDIKFTVTGGASLYEVNAEAYANDSTLTSDGDIIFTATAGTASGSSLIINAYAKVGIYDSILTSAENIEFTATGGTATNSLNDPSANVKAYAQSYVCDSTLTSGINTEFTAIGGTATNSSIGEIDLADTTALASAYDESVLTSLNGNILFNATGGTVNDIGPLSTKMAYANVSAYNDSVLKSLSGDIVFNATGGSADDLAYARAYTDIATLTSDGNIVFNATGGTADTFAFAKVDTINSTLTAGDNIEFEAEATVAGHNANVDIDVDSTLTAGSNDRDLIINADGTIDFANSNIYAEISGTTIDVDDVEEGNITLISTQVGGPGTITGAGELTVYSGYQSIDITNDSDLDLQLNDMSTAISGEIIKTGNYTGSYTENTIIDSASKNITVTNNGDSDVEFVGDILNSNGNVGITNKSKLITGTGGLISTRNIGSSTDYANGTSIGNSGNVTLTSPLGCILNNSEIYSHANAGFNGGDVVLNADASSLVGASFVSTMTNITDSTIKANDINIIAKAGTITDSNAVAQIIFDNSSLISNGEIEISATGGVINYDPASILAYMALVEVHTGDSIFTSDGKIKITGRGGTGKISALADIQDHGSTFTSGDDIEFIATGGSAIAMSAAEIGTNGSTFTSNGKIDFTATGGSTTGTASSTDYADTVIAAIGSTFTSDADIQFTSTAGIANSRACATASAHNSNLLSGRDIVFTATGGVANTVDSASAFADSYTINSTLTSLRDIVFSATGGTANAATINSPAAVILDNSDFTSGRDINFESETIQLTQGAIVEIEDDSNLTAGSHQRNLVINADGTIDLANSNIYAEITGTSVNVGDVEEGNISLTSTNIDGPGEIKGAGVLNIYRGYQSVDINNNSNLDLRLGNINTAISGQIVKNGNYTGTYTENIITNNTPQDVNIDNNGASDVLFSAGDVFITSKNLDINSNGSIGTAGANGNIDIRTSGIFTALANNGIYISHSGPSNLTLGDVRSTTGSINITTSNDFIINSGARVSSGAANNAIVLNSLSGNFINNSNANALLTPNGRWLVYANDPADCTLGNLAYNKQYNVNYQTTPPESFTKQGSYMLYSIAPFLTVVADNKSRSYGYSDPEFTISLIGFIDGDTKATAVSGSANFYTPATQSSNVGSYSINISQGNLLANLGYQFNNFVGGTLTIDKADLVVAADNKIKIYGNDNPLFTASYRGFVLGQGLDALGGSLDFATLAQKMSMPGFYAIDPFGFTSSNYNIIYESGTLAVVPGGGANGLIETIVGSITMSSLGNVVPASHPLPPQNLPPAGGESGSSLPLIDTSGLNLD